MLHDNLPDVPEDEIGCEQRFSQAPCPRHPRHPRRLLTPSSSLPHTHSLADYAGMVESLFAVVQFLTGMLWGSLSDRIGRKPVLLIGLAGTFLSVNNAFGLSTSFRGMILARAINGLMNGNIAVIKSVLGELTDDSNQARAFTFLPLMFAIGSIIGPTLGGTFSDPATTFPGWFGDSDFLKKYPYWLPCGIAGLLNLFGLLVGFFFLREVSCRSARSKLSPAPVCG